jgi:hypothetical protein
MQIEPLNAEVFRRELAEVIKPSQVEVHTDRLRDIASELGFVLAITFNRKVLEVVTLWDRIASGLNVACQEVDDGDVERIVNICLDHVKADPVRVAACPQLADLLEELLSLSSEQKKVFVEYLKKHLYLAVIYGRKKWEQFKEDSDVKD